MAPKARPAIDRFTERVVLQPNGCWTLGEVGLDHYTRLYLEDGRSVGGHRYAYEWLVGPIPEGLHLDHLCRNPGCVHPDHVEPVTPRENYLRGVSIVAQNARKTHCPKGHPLSGDNLYIHQKRGLRDCKECRREAVRRYRARRAT